MVVDFILFWPIFCWSFDHLARITISRLGDIINVNLFKFVFRRSVCIYDESPESVISQDVMTKCMAHSCDSHIAAFGEILYVGPLD